MSRWRRWRCRSRSRTRRVAPGSCHLSMANMHKQKCYIIVCATMVMYVHVRRLTVTSNVAQMSCVLYRGMRQKKMFEDSNLTSKIFKLFILGFVSCNVLIHDVHVELSRK